jgi:hypothetical protein
MIRAKTVATHRKSMLFAGEKKHAFLFHGKSMLFTTGAATREKACFFCLSNRKLLHHNRKSMLFLLANVPTN